jgi:hypothetical protein
MSEHRPSGAGCTLEEARAAKKAALRVFERLTQVSGIGITRHGPGYGLKINVGSPLPKTATVPQEVEGVPVRIEVVGPIRKRTAS